MTLEGQNQITLQGQSPPCRESLPWLRGRGIWCGSSTCPTLPPPFTDYWGGAVSPSKTATALNEVICTDSLVDSLTKPADRCMRDGLPVIG